MRARFANHLLAVLGMEFDGDGVAHGAGGHKECGFLAGDERGAAFELIHGGVFAVDVVAHFGVRHGLAHLRGGLGDGVTA